MNKFVNWILGFILVVMSIMVCWLSVDLRKTTKELVEVYNTEPELIIVDSLVYDTMYLTKTELVRLPIVDTILTTDTIVAVERDSVFVEIPIELKHYNDTLSNTLISFDLRGYNCEIKDLSIQSILSVPTQEKVPKKGCSNFGIGVGLGITYIDKVRFVPNVGIYYKLF